MIYLGTNFLYGMKFFKSKSSSSVSHCWHGNHSLRNQDSQNEISKIILRSRIYWINFLDRQEINKFKISSRSMKNQQLQWNIRGILWIDWVIISQILRWHLKVIKQRVYSKRKKPDKNLLVQWIRNHRPLARFNEVIFYSKWNSNPWS